jgi:hypothetical protein
MQKQLVRIGTERHVNESKLNEFYAFDLIYGGFYEFVYIPDYYPWKLLNGTWTGALGHLINGTAQMGGWKLYSPFSPLVLARIFKFSFQRTWK